MSRRPRVMVCVTRQKTCERLIRVGKKLVNGSEGELVVVHVSRVGDNFLGSNDEGEALDYLFQEAKNAGANLTVIRSDNILNTLLDQAKKNNITEIVMGESPEAGSGPNLIQNMERMLPKVKFNIIPTRHN
ncbi:MAG: hypothetical protein WAP98_05440 [Caldicoprobacterales bacterium]|nr:universal stress protein UspA [Clostridia bacterium]